MNNILYGRIIKKINNKVTVFVKKSYKIILYKKKIFYYIKIIAFDMFNESNNGDYVLIKKSRPLTKTVCWVLSKIIEKVKLI